MISFSLEKLKHYNKTQEVTSIFFTSFQNICAVQEE